MMRLTTGLKNKGVQMDRDYILTNDRQRKIEIGDTISARAPGQTYYMFYVVVALSERGVFLAPRRSNSPTFLDMSKVFYEPQAQIASGQVEKLRSKLKTGW